MTNNSSQYPYNPGSPFVVSSGFGPRTLGGAGTIHPGVDYAAPVGTPVPAASGGTVVYSGYNDTGGFGYTVIVQSIGSDGQPYYALYGHLSGDGMPALGSQVTQGQSIGAIGAPTAGEMSTGPHLHFELLNARVGSQINSEGSGSLGFRAGDPTLLLNPGEFQHWAGGSPYDASGSAPAVASGGPQDGFDQNGNLLSYTDTALYDDQSRIVGDILQYSNGTTDTVTYQFDSSGNLTGDVWNSSNGQHGSDMLQADGSWTNTTYDNAGNVIERGTSQTQADGSGRVELDTFTATGQALISTVVTGYADGTTATTQVSNTYDGNGGWLSTSTETDNRDGTSKKVTTNSDGSSATVVDDGQRTQTTTYDQSGRLVADATVGDPGTAAQGYSSVTNYSYVDGFVLSTTVNSDGTSSGESRSLDGSTGFWHTDAAGNYYSTYSDADGSYGLENTRPDGYDHSEDHGADGSFSISTTNPDGSYTTQYKHSDGSSGDSRSDGQGNTFAENLSASGDYQDSWTKSDGSRGDDTLKADGSVSHDTHDAAGNYSSQYQNADGSHGSEIDRVDGYSHTESYGADGSFSLATHNADGSYTTQQKNPDGSTSDSHGDGLGNNFSEQLDINGTYQDSWTKSDGSSGADYRQADGFTSFWTRDPAGDFHSEHQNADGSHGSLDTRPDGYSDTLTYSLDGSFQEVKLTPDGGAYEIQKAADGSYWERTDNADGSWSKDYKKADGSWGDESHDATGGWFMEDDDAQGNHWDSEWRTSGYSKTDYLGVDGSYEHEVQNPDGSSHHIQYSASGFKNWHDSDLTENFEEETVNSDTSRTLTWHGPDNSGFSNTDASGMGTADTKRWGPDWSIEYIAANTTGPYHGAGTEIINDQNGTQVIPYTW